MGPSARHGVSFAKSLNGLGHGLEMGGGLIMLKTLSWAFLGAGVILLGIITVALSGCFWLALVPIMAICSVLNGALYLLAKGMNRLLENY